MADGRTARPVSSEIMTVAAAMAGSPRGGSADIVDADFEVVVERRPRQAASHTDPKAVVPENGLAGGMEVLRRDAEKQGAFGPFSRRGGPAFWTVGAGLAFAAFWVSGGHALSSRLPFPGAARAAPMFTIAGVKSRIDTAGGRQILFVDGEATNGGDAAGVLPELEIHVTGQDGRATSYKLGTSRTPLAPGGRFAFSSRLALPNSGVKTVAVAFGE